MRYSCLTVKCSGVSLIGCIFSPRPWSWRKSDHMEDDVEDNAILMYAHFEALQSKHRGFMCGCLFHDPFVFVKAASLCFRHNC